MPKLIARELQILDRLSNKIYDALYSDLEWDEKFADLITREVIILIIKRAEDK